MVTNRNRRGTRISDQPLSVLGELTTEALEKRRKCDVPKGMVPDHPWNWNNDPYSYIHDSYVSHTFTLPELIMVRRETTLLGNYSDGGHRHPFGHAIHFP